ncbi:uncharacterized protein LOC143025656 isoform X2 [Oratosquilla oratoria]|uniref:uncharacterized protein LOC143025656 isoform X2 n=1 Tax=Oratosquilla oratoria TaxID=337810 RepID=UPI003F769FC3
MNINPLEECGQRHPNGTLEFHECMCEFDYTHQRSNVRALKFQHCQYAHDMRKINNFELYVVIAAVVGVVLILGIAALCSCKWYIQTKTNPCSCCFCSCCSKKRKRKDRTPGESVEANGSVLDGKEVERSSGRSWTAMHVDMSRDGQSAVDPDPPPNRKCDKEDHSLCMNFCLSDPVQDCCEFFDCDLMWRKRNIYTIPIFGKRKSGIPLQRRPTRAAPPPPKPTVPPAVKNPEPIVDDYGDCEPVPEAPPSPEPPVRTDQPRAMYVDPLSFLQRPFLRSREKAAAAAGDDEDPEPLYSKVKDFVFGMARKSASLASLNKLGLSENPNGSPSRGKAPSDTKGKKSNRSSKTGSLASLHNLSNEQLDTSYGKRSMSLASLDVLDSASPTHIPTDKRMILNNKPGSRMSLHNVDEDDIPPAKRKDEYIDLEEMSKRLAAKMALERAAAAAAGMPMPISTQSGRETSTFHSPSAAMANSKSNFFRTHASSKDPISSVPVFVPASAYGQPNAGYYPAVPATGNKPAIPARSNVSSPAGSGGTLGRPKPIVPPRPTNTLGPGSASPGSTHSLGGSSSPRLTHTMGGSASPRLNHTIGGSASPKPRAPTHPGGTLTRPGGTLNKPVSPPPPPPVRGPIESSI